MAFSHYRQDFDQSEITTPEAPKVRNLESQSIATSSPLFEHDDTEFAEFHHATEAEVALFDATMNFWSRTRFRNIGENRFEAFMKAWLLRKGNEGKGAITKRVNRLLDVFDDDRVKAQLAVNKDWEEYLVSDQKRITKLVTNRLRQELVLLPKQAGFRRQPKVTDQTLDIDYISQALTQGPQSVEKYAPTWHTLLFEVMVLQRAGWKSYKQQGKNSNNSEENQKLFYIIMVIMVKIVARNTSNFFPNVMGKFLLVTGTQRDTIEVLCGMGISDSYSSLIKENKQMSAQVKVFSS